MELDVYAVHPLDGFCNLSLSHTFLLEVVLERQALNEIPGYSLLAKVVCSLATSVGSKVEFKVIDVLLQSLLKLLVVQCPVDTLSFGLSTPLLLVIKALLSGGGLQVFI